MGKGVREKMNEKVFLLALCAMLLALCSFAAAQQAKKVPRIGYLCHSRRSTLVYDRPRQIRRACENLATSKEQNISTSTECGGEYSSATRTCGRAGELKVDVIV